MTRGTVAFWLKLDEAPPTRTAAPGGAASKRGLRLVAFHGAGDRCIAASLAMRSYAQLIDLGFSALRLHLEPYLAHCESNEAESALLCDALASWGLVPRPSGRATFWTTRARATPTTR